MNYLQRETLPADTKVTEKSPEEIRADLVLACLQQYFGEIIAGKKIVVKPGKVMAEITISGRQPIGFEVTQTTHRIWGIKGAVAQTIKGEVDLMMQATATNSSPET